VEGKWGEGKWGDGNGERGKWGDEVPYQPLVPANLLEFVFGFLPAKLP
jgi:hypothetical protein